MGDESDNMQIDRSNNSIDQLQSLKPPISLRNIHMYDQGKMKRLKRSNRTGDRLQTGNFGQYNTSEGDVRMGSLYCSEAVQALAGVITETSEIFGISVA